MEGPLGREEIQTFAGNLLAELTLIKQDLAAGRLSEGMMQRVRLLRSEAERGRTEYVRATTRLTVAQHFATRKRNKAAAAMQMD